VRYNNFKANLKTIEKLNANSPNKVFGINKFTDMSRQEFRAKYLMKKGMIKNHKTLSADQVLVPTVKATVDRFDWRDKGAVTSVKDQKQCGSCWAFSATENIESVWILGGHGDNKSIILSPQQIVDCDDDDTGCDGGDTPTAFNYVKKAGGLESEKSYPYRGHDGDCKFKVSSVVAKISGFKYATTNSDETTMKGNLVSYAPLSICVDAANWQFYNGGILTPRDCGTDLDHCVQLIGFDATTSHNYWMVRNSWGTDWGIDGYIKLQMGGDTCGCADEATTAIL
jgi:cathepsin F